MTTIEGARRATGQPGRWAAARVQVVRGWRRVKVTATAARARYRRTVLTAAGLGSFAAAGYQINVCVGLVVTGATLLMFEWLSGGDG